MRNLKEKPVLIPNPRNNFKLSSFTASLSCQNISIFILFSHLQKLVAVYNFGMYISSYHFLEKTQNIHTKKISHCLKTPGNIEVEKRKTAFVQRRVCCCVNVKSAGGGDAALSK